MKHLALTLALMLAGCCCQQPTYRPAAPPATSAIISPEADARFCGGLPLAVPFVTRDNSLVGGDDITILGVRGDRPTLEPGGQYCIWGRFTLQSRDRASLCVWSTDGNTEAEPHCIDVAGGGRFLLRFRVKEPMGLLHISFYPFGGGSGLGGVYFVNPGSS